VLITAIQSLPNDRLPPLRDTRQAAKATGFAWQGNGACLRRAGSVSIDDQAECLALKRGQAGTPGGAASRFALTPPSRAGLGESTHN
jgi:hypothetical protein